MSTVTKLFPPQTERRDEVELLLTSFASVVDDNSAIYVSSPLTTGVRAFEWHRRRGRVERSTFAAHVVEPNREEAAAFVRALRATTRKIVIDPTALNIRGWGQSDYRYFWGRVIDVYCDEVVLRDGWQFSSGCSYELLVAWVKGARLLREDLTPLHKCDAEDLLEIAVAETEAHGTSAAFLRAVLDALSESDGPGRE